MVQEDNYTTASTVGKVSACRDLKFLSDSQSQTRLHLFRFKRELVPAGKVSIPVLGTTAYMEKRVRDTESDIRINKILSVMERTQTGRKLSFVEVVK